MRGGLKVRWGFPRCAFDSRALHEFDESPSLRLCAFFCSFSTNLQVRSARRLFVLLNPRGGAQCELLNV